MKLVFNIATVAAGLAFAATPVAAADGWETLGCRGVSFAVDQDTIPVGRADGQYKRLRLTVKDAPIEFYSLRVVFGNGNHQDIKINQRVPANSVSNRIDLTGAERGIKEVKLLYKSEPTFKGKGEVCVEGKSD